MRLARAPEAVATAFREGRITLLAAEAILRGAPLDETVTLRKLQEQVRPEPGLAGSDELVLELPVSRLRSGDRKVAIFAPKAGKAALAWAGSGR